MLTHSKLTHWLILAVVFLSLVIPVSVPQPAAAASQPVLLLALGVHVEPFGAVPSQIVGGGKVFTSRGVKSQDYHDSQFFQRHVTDIKNLAAVMEKHGGRLTVEVQTPFTTVAAQNGNALLSDLENKGHEIALHFHEDKHLGNNCEALPVSTWTAVMAEEISYIKKAGASSVRTWSGGNLYEGVLKAGAAAGLDVYSDWKNPQSQTADTVTFGLHPWRPAEGPDPDDMSGFARNDPDGKVIFLPWGVSSTGGLFGPGRGKADAMFETLKQSIDLSLSQAQADKVNVFHFVVHPGEITGIGTTPYASLDKFLTEYIDPLVASGRARWATYSGMADAYKVWESSHVSGGVTASSSTSPAVSTVTSSQGYMTFVINVHDWVNVDDSADTLIRAISLFQKYGVRGDFYLTAPVLQAYADKRPDVIEKLKSGGMTISYHVRPPHPLYNGFDDSLQNLSDEELYKTLKDYETYRLDLATGGLDTGKPGGYSYVKQVFGAAPVTIGAPNDDRQIKDTALKIYAEMGARAVVMYHETGTKADKPFEYVNGMLVRPSDFSITRWLAGDKKDTFWWNFMKSSLADEFNPTAYLKKRLDEWDNSRQPFVTSLIHENNFYRQGAESWTYYYFSGSGKEKPLKPPYNLNAVDLSRERTQGEQEAIWSAYEEMVAYAAANMTVVTSSDIVALASGSATTANSQQPAVPVPTAKSGTVEKNIVYGNAGGEKLTMDIYYPDEIVSALPAILYVHGGAWMKGSKELGKSNMDVQGLLDRGFLVASINYRLAPKYKFPAQIEDVKCAVRYLRANVAKYGIDSNRIGAMGGSAGGHLVALLGTSDDDDFNSSGGNPGQSARVKAVADMFGPADLTAEMGTNNISVMTQVFGTTDKSSQILKDASPVYYVSGDDPAFFILHGDKDQTVPLLQSQLLYDALKNAGVSAELLVV
ncbi:MAG: alpha/beta hydrolase fold domain-containing protein, partial [Dehalococcoidia bacterium]|nr:alpha/beta hydrolase fold domain-containing protein [Dehalococcoidia bacterium]